jgi:hypothetical protein
MTVGVLLNGGRFKGAALDDMTSKPHDGSVIPGYYREKKYAEIERYIKEETDGFTEFCSRIYEELPNLLEKFKQP